jgi:YHS domain-containing protein
MSPPPSAPVDPMPKADGQGDPSSATQRALTRVEPSLVCMVNNQFMGRPQIPVTVDGKTYFGCCEMCKGRLNSDPVSRTAKDPVTGADVDKALAVIAKNDVGAVLYFEDEASLAKYMMQ